MIQRKFWKITVGSA